MPTVTISKCDICGKVTEVLDHLEICHACETYVIEHAIDLWQQTLVRNPHVLQRFTHPLRHLMYSGRIPLCSQCGSPGTDPCYRCQAAERGW